MNREEVCDACPHSLGTPEGGDLRCPHLPSPYAKPCQLAAVIRDAAAVCPGPDPEWRERFATALPVGIQRGCGGGAYSPPPPHEGPLPPVEQWDSVAAAATASPVLMRLAICDGCVDHTADGRCRLADNTPVGAFVGKPEAVCLAGRWAAIGQ